MKDDRVFRVAVWSTGGIGSIAVRAVAENPGTELVGVWVHSPDKAGRDAGEIVGIGPIGVTATDDADALIALRPDCVVYAANGPERDAAAVRLTTLVTGFLTHLGDLATGRVAR